MEGEELDTSSQTDSRTFRATWTPRTGERRVLQLSGSPGAMFTIELGCTAGACDTIPQDFEELGRAIAWLPDFSDATLSSIGAKVIPEDRDIRAIAKADLALNGAIQKSANADVRQKGYKLYEMSTPLGSAYLGRVEVWTEDVYHLTPSRLGSAIVVADQTGNPFYAGFERLDRHALAELVDAIAKAESFTSIDTIAAQAGATVLEANPSEHAARKAFIDAGFTIPDEALTNVDDTHTFQVTLSSGPTMWLVTGPILEERRQEAPSVIGEAAVLLDGNLKPVYGRAIRK